MDFITGPPLPNGCEELLVVTDKFIKMAHLIPLSSEAADLARIFAREIGGCTACLRI